MVHRKTLKLLIILVAIYAVYNIIIFLSLIVFPLPEKFLEKDYSTVYLGSNSELLRIDLSSSDKYRIKLNLENMSDYLKKGFIAYEDRMFYFHPGINPFSFARALAGNIMSKRVVSGASTISMQIAKIMEPKKRNIKSKIQEILRAVQLEKKYTKKELLEIYLNIVPMGGNIEGVGAASYLYFGKSAKHLSIGESAVLISLPKSPNKLRPDEHPEEAKTQRNMVIERIKDRLNLNSDLLKQAFSEKIPDSRFLNPYETPGIVARVKSEGPQFVKKCAVDMVLQKFCESVLQKQIKHLKEKECYNGAMIVIDNKTMDVLVYIGSADFYDLKHCGQINCADILRSPGSLLKPFLYARAMENGIITPNKMVFDVERSYDGYVPANFDKKYQGPVTALEALICSLNVPAVNLEYQLNKEGLYSFIKNAHFTDKSRNCEHTGLSLVLGAYPLTLEELVRLYSCFANNGKLRELNFFVNKENKQKNEGFTLMQPPVCYIISSMLSEVNRPDLPQCWEFTHNRGRIAFKTGTSFGLKDAWCIGYNPDYTVGVWFGNADCKSSSALIGMEASAPVVVEVFNHLTRYKDSWFKKPENVSKRQVCALSGEKAGPYCKKIVSDYYIPGVSSNDECSVHKLIYIRKSDGTEVCRSCMSGKKDEYYSKIAEIWPADIADYFRNSGKHYSVIPKHNLECNSISIDSELKIKSPSKNGHYTISRSLPDKFQKIPLKAESNKESELIYWFLDGKFIFKSSPDKELFISPKPGEHEISIVDTKGRTDKVKFRVSTLLKPNSFSNQN